ncbi:hypothetical protein [Streptomyces sp. bgisy091]|uniref:hypothetical protein n=1 Tax=Streptomyces sp. bgisy091 TaxID=3413778 RepID=UPI003D70BC55
MSKDARSADSPSARTGAASGCRAPAPVPMVRVNDLVVREDESAPAPGPHGGTSWPDPLREPDALREAQLLECRVSQLTSTASLLFELRTAMQIDEGNAALLVMRGLRSLDWTAGAAPEGPTARTVVSGVPGRLDDLFRAEFSFFPDSRLEILGERAEFYVLEAQGIGDVPPGHTEPGHTEPGHTEPGHTEPGHTEPGHTEPGAPELRRSEGRTAAPPRGLLPSWDSHCTVLRASGSD